MIEKMEIDIGSLIYILVTIIAVIGGIAGKKKKPAGKKSRGGFFSNLESQLESFTTEAKQAFNVEQDPVFPKDEVIIEQDEVVMEQDEVLVERDYFETMSDEYDKRQAPELLGEMAASYEGLYSPDDEVNDPLMEAEGISVTDALELIDLEEDEISFDDQAFIEEFDARRAIIYSAIINRIEI